LHKIEIETFESPAILEDNFRTAVRDADTEHTVAEVPPLEWIKQRSKVFVCWAKSAIHQCPRTGLAAVTSNGKSSYDATMIYV